MLTGRKLALTLAFTALVAVAFGAGCRGFFPKPTIASFVISPANSTVPFPNGTQQMAAFGTDTDGNPTGNITNKITWSSSDPGVIAIGDASISGSTPGGGVITPPDRFRSELEVPLAGGTTGVAG